MTTAEDLDRIIAGEGTKADRARALFALGCERTKVVELLAMSYSQAHSIWKALQNGHTPQPRGKKKKDQEPRSSMEGLNLRPNQTRFLDQDGHTVKRVDTNGGPACSKCWRKVFFSLRYLAFVHEDSDEVPTNLRDVYQ